MLEVGRIDFNSKVNPKLDFHYVFDGLHVSVSWCAAAGSRRSQPAWWDGQELGQCLF